MLNQTLPDWYDDWKTSPPKEEIPDTYCIICGRALYEDWYEHADWVSTLDGDVCNDCLGKYEGEEL